MQCSAATSIRRCIMQSDRRSERTVRPLRSARHGMRPVPVPLVALARRCSLTHTRALGRATGNDAWTAHTDCKQTAAADARLSGSSHCCCQLASAGPSASVAASPPSPQSPPVRRRQAALHALHAPQLHADQLEPPPPLASSPLQPDNSGRSAVTQLCPVKRLSRDEQPFGSRRRRAARPSTRGVHRSGSAMAAQGNRRVSDQ